MMQKWTKHPGEPITIAFLIFDQFSNLCMSNCLEPLRAANSVTRGHQFDWMIFTLDGSAVQSSSGIQVLPHAALASLSQADYLFVHASYEHQRHDTPATRRALGRAARKADTVVGMDAGPWLMASAGLLSGRRATIHSDLIEPFSERFLDISVERARDVRDGSMVTCAGAMSAMDLTLRLISDHLGVATRLEIEDQFMQPESGLAMPVPNHPASDPLVWRAVQLMRENIERPLPLVNLARSLSCQSRTLDRRFRAALGAPPGTVYRHLRLTEARKMLEGTFMSISEIAVRCGYESPAALARAIRRRYGQTPSNLRARR